VLFVKFYYKKSVIFVTIETVGKLNESNLAKIGNAEPDSLVLIKVIVDYC